MRWNELTNNQLERLEKSISARLTECVARMEWSTVDKLRDRKYQIQQALATRSLAA